MKWRTSNATQLMPRTLPEEALRSCITSNPRLARFRIEVEAIQVGARKKCSERLLLKDAYWNSNRPK